MDSGGVLLEALASEHTYGNLCMEDWPLNDGTVSSDHELPNRDCGHWVISTKDEHNRLPVAKQRNSG
jgi:hypothetical protein